MPPSDKLVRQVLRAPDFIRRAAALQAKAPEERWMLRQPKDTRESFIAEVLDRGGDDRIAEIWMLRQPQAIRESYIREVLEPALPEHLATPDLPSSHART
jgi:hypothetical protein